MESHEKKESIYELSVLELVKINMSINYFSSLNFDHFEEGGGEVSEGFRFFTAQITEKCHSLKFSACLDLLLEPNASYFQILKTPKSKKNLAISRKRTITSWVA